MPEHHSPKLLDPPDYSAEEQQAVIDFVLALRKSHIQAFLKQVELRMSGTKEDLRERLHEALDGGDLTYERLVDFLDSLAPWGKQHVFLYQGPRSDVQEWRDPDHALRLLKQHRLGKLFNATLPLILPGKLTLSSITHADGKLRVTAVEKREYTERTPQHDEEKETESGERITLKAYIHHLTRTLAAFEWDLNANVAMLQITQLQEEGDYEKLAEQFCELVKPWLDIKQFSPVDLRPVIRSLHEIEKNGQPEARSHGIDYRSPRGRRVSARSPTPRDSVFGGEGFIDEAMDSVRKNGIGHLGNFYWLSRFKPGTAVNPLAGDVHVIIVGANSRVNFPTPNTEEAVRYVLHRVRALSSTAPGPR
ncbi:MAG: hypothetical protein ABSF98_24530 [Bryobacteraceae bacterium]|jgi:hypothetical protein